MKQHERETLYRLYAEMKAEEEGVEFTPYYKKELVAWIKKQLAKKEV